MNIMDAIYSRKSVRKYLNQPLSEETFIKIQDMIDSSKRLYPEIPMDIHIVKEGKKIHEISSGFIGSYGKIEAPHYLVATSKNTPGHLENVGFTLENIVLLLTTMGIGTCWIGGSIKKELLKDIIDMKEDQIPIIVVSFGTPQNSGDLMKKMVGSHKRKDLKDLVEGKLTNEWLEVMNAVRVAPSAVNFQPWRFIKNEDSVDVYTVKKLLTTKHLEDMQRIDAGISISHLDIACKAKEIPLVLKAASAKERKNLNYIISGTF